MDDFGRSEKKKGGLTENQKGWLTFGAIALIGFFGAFYLMFFADEQQKLATELATEIRALEGDGYGKKMNKLVSRAFEKLGEQDESARSMLQELLENMQSKADFSPIKEFADGEFGGVEIDTATLSSRISHDQYKNVVIKKTLAEPNKYLFQLDSESHQLTGQPSGSTWMITNYDNAKGFVEFDDSKESIESFEIAAENASFKDGSGNIEYVSLKNLFASLVHNKSSAEAGFSAKFSFEQANVGQMFKLLVGDIKPIQFDIDMNYEGDDFQKILRIIEQTPDFLTYAEKGAGELAKQASAAEKFSGNVQLNNFSLTSEDMGFGADADLKFEGFPFQPIPVGDVKFSVKSYQELISYLQNFMPVEMDIEAMKEYFVDNGTDLIFTATFDGSRNIKLGNGKIVDIVANMKRPTLEDYSAPEQDSGYSSELETVVGSDSTPVEIPQVETRPLP